jgi:diguanylate cyclase (GGDEF)-like protein
MDRATPTDADAAKVAQDLARVEAKVDAARAVLVRLLQEVVVAEHRLNTNQAGQLLEANQNLVVTALSNQADADAATKALALKAHLAEHDPLTKLPNRMLMLDRCAQAIAAARRNGGRLAMLFLDLDNFKRINDDHGHAAGDEVLRQVAERLRGAVRDVDTVSRHGGDEFLVLLSEVAQPSDPAVIAAKLRAAVHLPYRVGGHELQLTASIGIALYPDDCDNGQALINHADAAMYRVKRQAQGQAEAVGPGHGQHPPPTGDGQHPPPTAGAASRRGMMATDPDQRHANLREANERLVLAALTAQQLQAAAERAQQEQAEFLAAVAHELSSPMAPIRLATAMLGRAQTDEPLLPRVQALIDRHLELVQRLVGAVSQVTGAGSHTAGSETPHAALAPVVHAAAAACRPMLDTQQQTLSLSLPVDPVQVAARADDLQQILCNLLDNASKYSTDHREIRLYAQVQGPAVVVTVADDGIGITAQALPGIFEPFVQDSRAFGFNGMGVGIGLTAVRALTESMGGQIVASSEGRGCGSRFVLTLPLATSPVSPAGALDAAGTAP